MEKNRKRLIVIILATVLTVALSFSALSYSWFVRQVKLEKSHVFPATGFEILQFESEVSKSAQEGKLYPATLKREYYKNGFGLDYYNYNVTDINGVLPEYVDKPAGKVNFKVDLSYWSGLEITEAQYQIIKINQNVKIKNAEQDGKSTRDLTKTGEMAVNIDFKEHDKSIYVSDSEPVLRRGQFPRNGSVLVADNLDRNHHYQMFTDSDTLVLNEQHAKVHFGDYNKSFYSASNSNDYKVNVNNAYQYYNSDEGIDLMKYNTNFIFYKEKGNDYFESLDCWDENPFSNNNINIKTFKFIKQPDDQNLKIKYVPVPIIDEDDNNDETIYTDKFYYTAENVYLPSIIGLNFYVHKETQSLLIVKSNDNPGENEWDRLLPVDPDYSNYIGLVHASAGGGVYTKTSVILGINNVLYDRGKTVTIGDSTQKMLTHEFFNPATFDAMSDELVYCFFTDNNQSLILPQKKILGDFNVKNRTIGYFRDQELIHSSFDKYMPNDGDEILFVHNQTQEISPGDAGFDENNVLVPDPTRVTASNIVISDNHIVYKKEEILTRYIDIRANFIPSPAEVILFENGDFIPHETDITSIKTHKGKYMLSKAYLLSNNTVVLRDNILRVFTEYDNSTAPTTDIVLFQSGQIKNPEGINPHDYIKNDSIDNPDPNGYYVENVFLFPGDYAYKDLNTFKDHIMTSPVLPDDSTKKPIVFNGKLVMGRDSTFLLNIFMYIAVFDEDFDPYLKGETFVLNLSATFENV